MPATCGLELAEVLTTKDEPLNTDDILYAHCIYHESTPRTHRYLRGNKIAIDKDTHRAILDFIKSVPTTSGPNAVLTTKTFDEFLRADSPLPDPPELEMVPVFSRDHQPGRVIEQSSEARFSSSLQAVPNLPKCWLSQVDIKEEGEEDLANAHLDVVDGWRKYQHSFIFTP